MNNGRLMKYLVFYTLLIFVGGVLAGGLWLTTQGIDVPWGFDNPWMGEKIAQGQDEPPSGLSHSLVGEGTIQDIVEKTGPSVVKIETTTTVQGSQNNPFAGDPFFREFFGDSFRLQPTPRKSQGLGSGFIISQDGYILTNNHVIEGADKVQVYLTQRQEPYEAKIVGSDGELDLAILKINPEGDLPILKLGDSNQMKVGNWVIAIGNPYGLDHTVTVGVVSAKGRPLYIDGREFKDLIQTDASINPGNSGGPLLNLEGEVIGINTAINAQAQGIGFAIPSYTVQQVLDQLLEKGKVIRPWLGVYMQPVTEDLARYFNLAKAEGALIGAVQEGSPAYEAGLQRGDVILEFGGKAIKTPEDLQKLVNESKIGEKVVLLIHRQGKTTYISVTISERE